MTTQARLRYGVSILEPDGRIVGSTASELRQAIMAEIEACDEPRILINFKNVQTIDSVGLGMLIDVHNALMKRNGRLGIIHLRKRVRDMLIFTRVIRLLELFDSEDAAVSALSV